MWDRVDGVKRAAGKHAAGCGVALSYVLSFGLRSPFSFYRVCFELGRLTIGVLEALPYDYCKARRPWPAREDSSTRELASPIGLLTCAQQWIALLVSISKINSFLDDGCPRAQRAHGCPRAQRARAGCQAPAGSRAVRRLCINQILAAHPTAESWGPSTPSTRHLLDGVAVWVSHRSTEPARPRTRHTR